VVEVDAPRRPAGPVSRLHAQRSATVVRTLVVLLLGLLALVAWPSEAQAQSATLVIDPDGANAAVTTTGSNGGAEATTVSYVVGTDTYTISLNGNIAVTDNTGGAVTVIGSGTPSVTIAPNTGTVTSLTFIQGDGGNSYVIQSIGDPTTIQDTTGAGPPDTITVGNSGNMDGIGGAVTVNYSATTKADLILT